MQQVYVLKGIQNNLLGLPAIKALHLVVQADSIAQPVGRATDFRIPDQFPSLFEGLGNFQRGNPLRFLLPGSVSPAIQTNPWVSSGRWMN